jgi:RND family efflux transporter MFP subunit
MQTDVVRVFVDVPQNDVADINVGTAGTLTLQQWPGRTFPARVTRTSQAIDPTTRTLRIELDVPNPDRALLPGAYAMIRLQVSPAHPSLSIPVSALLFRPTGVQVATVNEANRVSLQPVTLGRDFGTTVEVTRGLEGGERVVANPTDGVASGDPVRIAGEADHV